MMVQLPKGIFLLYLLLPREEVKLKISLIMVKWGTCKPVFKLIIHPLIKFWGCIEISHHVCWSCPTVCNWKSFIFSLPELKAQVNFPDRLLSVVCQSIHLSVIFSHLSSSSPEQTDQIQPKCFGIREFQVCPNKGPWQFPRGSNYEIVEIHWQLSPPEPLGQF